jgi:hypothetical protein
MFTPAFLHNPGWIGYEHTVKPFDATGVSQGIVSKMWFWYVGVSGK